MTTLFDPVTAGDLRLPNRVVMAPLTRNRAPGAVPPALAATYYAQRAGAGLIVSEGVAISPQAQGYADVPGLYTEEQVDGWARVTHAVHEADGRIVAQLWHVGRVSHASLQPGGQPPVGPSAIRAETRTVLLEGGKPHFVAASEPRALDAEELPGIVHAYAGAARNAVQTAGFDGVEIHAANGYLLEQFLKSSANHRRDDYGGSLTNRCRLTLEVVRAVVDAVGAGKVGIRLSPVTPAGGIDEPHPQPLYEHLARALGPLGLAYVHVIEGATGGAREVEGRPFDYAAFKAAYRHAGGKGAWMVNNGYDGRSAEAAVASGAADLVAFGRAFIANPDLVTRLRRHSPLNPPDRDTFYGGGAHGYTDYQTLVDAETGAGANS